MRALFSRVLSGATATALAGAVLLVPAPAHATSVAVEPRDAPASVASSPVIGRDLDGKLNVFVRGSDGLIWYDTQDAPSGDGWAGWRGIGTAKFVGSPAAERNGDGRLSVFARGVDNALWWATQLEPNGEFNDWVRIGGVITESPSVARNADSTIAVAVRTTPGTEQIWKQNSPNATTGTWTDVGGAIVGQPTLAAHADGRLITLVRGTDNGVWAKSQTSTNGPWQSGWVSVGGSTNVSPVAERGVDGRLRLFVLGTDNGLWLASQTAPNGAFGSYSRINSTYQSTKFSTSRQADGRITVVNNNQPGSLLCVNVQTSPTSSTFRLSCLGKGNASAVGYETAIGNNADGRLAVFTVDLRAGGGRQVWTRTQMEPNGTTYTEWSNPE